MLMHINGAWKLSEVIPLRVVHVLGSHASSTIKMQMVTHKVRNKFMSNPQTKSTDMQQTATESKQNVGRLLFAKHNMKHSAQVSFKIQS